MKEGLADIMTNDLIGKEATTKRPPIQKWVVVIGLLSLLYGAARCFFYRPNENASVVSIFFNVSVIAMMIGGGLGLTFRQPWAISVLGFGSWLGVIHMVYSIILVIALLGGLPTIPFVLGILALMVPLHGWPIFLLIWFRCHSENNERLINQ